MKKTVQQAKNGLKGEITIPSDKSISHRAAIFATLARGKSVIKNFSNGQDPKSSLEICKVLGAEVEFQQNRLIIKSDGVLKAPKKVLYCGNSGTTMRLMAGVLAGQNFNSVLTGDESLSNRPMGRIIEPLSLMGAEIKSNNNKAPLEIYKSELRGIEYKSPIASAQVKSAILLAGLFADGKTSFTEEFLSRNHTELMLKYMGAKIETYGLTTTVQKSILNPSEFEIAGDISSAAYFIAAGLIVPNSDLILKNVGLNPTRTGILEVLRQMGADIEVLDERVVSNEVVGDLRVKSSNLKGCEIKGEIIPKLIDEIPIIAVLATQAEGQTVIKDAGDLRNKESDRIKTTVSQLKKLGADIEETKDGMIIRQSKLQGGVEVETFSDHRLAMSLYVAGLLCGCTIDGFEWAGISFPEFDGMFSRLNP